MLFAWVNRFRELYYQKRGQRMLSRGVKNKAYECFEKAILLNNNYVNQFNMALVLITMNQHKNAETYLLKVLEKFPDNEMVLMTLGDVYSILRNWDKAIECFAHLTTINPENSVYLKFLTRARDVVLREKFVVSRELFFKGMQLQEDKKYSEALSVLQESAEFDQDNAVIFNTMGLVSMMAGKTNEEISSYFEKAVLLAPQNEGYKHNLAQIKAKIKK